MNLWRIVLATGFRIELSEIEVVISTQAGVKQATVLVAGTGASQQLVAYVTPDTVDADEVLHGELPAAVYDELN